MKKIIIYISIVFSLMLTCSLFSQWVQVGPSNSMTINALTIKDSVIFAGARTNGLFTSSNNGQNWTQTSLFTQTINALSAGSYYVFAGTSNSDSGIYITSNNGLNWIPHSVNHQLVNCIAVQNANVFVGTPGGIARSTNNGQTWFQIFSEVGNTPGLLVKDSMIFAGSNGYGVYLSTNYGLNWIQDGLNYLFIPTFAINGNEIYAGACQGDTALYHTTNYGGNWNKVGSLIQCVHTVAFSNNIIILATQSPGIYITTNNGQNWIQKNEGIGSINILCLLIANGYIFAGSDMNGIWRRSISELIGINPIAEEIPSEYKLSQNYPNPFNPNTKIKFDVPSKVKSETSNVKLNLYDILGREVVTLVNEKLQPGTYEVEWDGSNYSSGVYFYKITILDPETSSGFAFSETKRMVLIK